MRLLLTFNVAHVVRQKRNLHLKLMLLSLVTHLIKGCGHDRNDHVQGSDACQEGGEDEESVAKTVLLAFKSIPWVSELS